MKSATKSDARRTILRIVALAFCIIPVTVSILCYFPVWRAEGGEVLLSGVAVLLLAVAALPIYKLISAHLRSPAAYTVWLIAFILFSLLSRIADEMAVISFTGLVGNVIGAVIYKLANGGKNEGA